MPASGKAFARDWLRLTQGIEASDDMVERANTLIVSSHAAVDRAAGKACVRQDSGTLFDVRVERFAAILTGQSA